MKISRQARRDAKSLFAASHVNGVLDDGRALNAVKALIAQKPRGYTAILSHFQRLVKLDVARRTAKVESAVPLDADLQASVQANLTRIYGAGLSLTFAQDPSLIGGLRIQVGSDVYDGSVKSRLESLGETI